MFYLCNSSLDIIFGTFLKTPENFYSFENFISGDDLEKLYISLFLIKNVFSLLFTYKFIVTIYKASQIVTPKESLNESLGHEGNNERIVQNDVTFGVNLVDANEEQSNPLDDSHLKPINADITIINNIEVNNQNTYEQYYINNPIIITQVANIDQVNPNKNTQQNEASNLPRFGSIKNGDSTKKVKKGIPQDFSNGKASEKFRSS